MSQTAAAPPRLSNRSGRKRPLVSLTPLIDVVFILLVFFMLATSFLDWRAIDLDAPVQAAAGKASDNALLVEIRGQDLRLAGETVSLVGLARRLKERLAEKPDQRLLIQPADRVPLQRTVTVLDRLKAAGAANLTLVGSDAAQVQ